MDACAQYVDPRALTGGNNEAILVPVEGNLSVLLINACGAV